MHDVVAPSPQTAPLRTPSDLSLQAGKDIAGALTVLLADVFALYLKTKNFHWHLSGPHFRDYHLMLDEQGEQIFATTDPIAERVRKVGGTTLRSIGQIRRIQRLLDNDADYVTPEDMLAELADDNQPAHPLPAGHPCGVHHPQRRGYHQPDRELDRRSRAPQLVPVRNHPPHPLIHALFRSSRGLS